MEISAVSFSRQISVQASQADSRETSKDAHEDFRLFIDDNEVTDFSLFVEQMLSSNDASFPVIMDFLKLNKLCPELSEIYGGIGYTIVTECGDKRARRRLIRNLSYLKLNGCDLNLELLNFLRSLTFGGKIIKHGDVHTNVEKIKTILPFCTSFFDDERYWSKIRYFCYDTVEVIDALRFLIANYGTERSCRFIQPPPRNAFSLKHLARNAVRRVIWSAASNRCNLRYYRLCRDHLPHVLFKYINFLD